MKIRYNISSNSWFDEFDLFEDIEPNIDLIWNFHPKNLLMYVFIINYINLLALNSHMEENIHSVV